MTADFQQLVDLVHAVEPLQTLHRPIEIGANRLARFQEHLPQAVVGVLVVPLVHRQIELVPPGLKGLGL